MYVITLDSISKHKGMENLENVKCVYIIKCAHFSPKIKCVLHVRNNCDLSHVSQ